MNQKIMDEFLSSVRNRLMRRTTAHQIKKKERINMCVVDIHYNNVNKPKINLCGA